MKQRFNTKLWYITCALCLTLQMSLQVQASSPSTDTKQPTTQTTPVANHSCQEQFCELIALEQPWPAKVTPPAQATTLLFDAFRFRVTGPFSSISQTENELFLKQRVGFSLALQILTLDDYPELKNSNIKAHDIPTIMFEVPRKKILQEKQPNIRALKLGLYKAARHTDFKTFDQVSVIRNGDIKAFLIKGDNISFNYAAYFIDLNIPGKFYRIEFNHGNKRNWLNLLGSMSIN
ncbi:hypothetical protein [Zooshikella sp. RANM57]|uniref:hypothetical protein n=1 Tax=Zooshikella sp. RANM57 TaxID=3425863 RepID=UPI003D6DDAC5